MTRPARSTAAFALFVLLVVWLSVFAPRAQAGVIFTPQRFADPADVAKSPLDIRSVRFGQQGVDMNLRIRTERTWDINALTIGGKQQLCIDIVSLSGSGPLCVVSNGAGGAALSFTPPGSTGPVIIDALVGQPDAHTLLANIAPTELGLDFAPFTWRARSEWTGTSSCESGCEDLAPDEGTHSGTRTLVALPSCYGAASRDPKQNCTNPDVAHSVYPSPSDADITPGSYCKPMLPKIDVHPCTFGPGDAPGRQSIVLTGDSHAAAYRAAVEVVAFGNNWHGIDITRGGCEFTPNQTDRDPTWNAGCHRWFQEVISWFNAHPEVQTVLTTSHWLPDTAARRADYEAGWQQLPASVKHIIVMRDPPRNKVNQPKCGERIYRAISQHRQTSTVCQLPRSEALPPDPNTQAAAESHQSRVSVVDLTQYMCNSVKCFEVVGGGLVRKDTGHLTNLFATSLGPYMLREVNKNLGIG